MRSRKLPPIKADTAQRTSDLSTRRNGEARDVRRDAELQTNCFDDVLRTVVVQLVAARKRH